MKRHDIRNAAELSRATGISWEIAKDIINCEDSVKLGNLGKVAKFFGKKIVMTKS